MNTILTPSGYKNISDINIGDEVVAFDVVTGEIIINTVEGKETVTPGTYSKTEIDEEIGTENFIQDVLTAYRINGVWDLCKYQSIWFNDNLVKHASQLQVGDIIFNGSDNDVEVTSIEEIVLTQWIRLSISGDHSFISDNLILHNASRFWVGGTANWDAVTTTNWSSTSGGGGGSSVPTSADDVTFDSLSNLTAYSVTMTATGNCNNITWGNPLSGVLTISGNAQTVIFGNSSAATGVIMSRTATNIYAATSGTKTITNNGVFTPSTVVFSGVGGTFQLVDNMQTGTTSVAWQISTGATFDANGKDVILTGRNVSFTGTANFTFFNLTRTGDATRTNTLSGTGFTCTGTFTCNGNSSINRVLISSATLGTNATITAATVTITNSDFQDITGAGAGSWNLSAITGGSGDCGGNSGITFTTPATQTATGTTSFTWSTHGWTSRVPLPQDNVIINNSFVASQTITVDVIRMGKDLTFSCTGSPVLSMAVAGSSIGVFGSVDMTGLGSISGTATPSFYGRSTQTIKSAGVTWGNGITSSGFSIFAFGGTYSLSDNLVVTNAMGLFNGTFNFNGFNVTNGTFTSTNTTVRTLTVGAGTWNITGNNATVWNTAIVTNLTYTTTPTVNFTYSGSTGTRTVSSSATTTALINVNVNAGTDSFAFATSSCAVNALNFTGFAGTINFSASTSIQVAGDMTVSTGMTITGGTSSISFVGATQNLTTNGKNLDFPIGFYSDQLNLLDNLSVGTSTARTIFFGFASLGATILNFNGFNITHFGLFNVQNLSISRTMAMGSSTYENTLTDATTVWTYSGTNFSITGTGTLKFSGSTANIRTFIGGGASYPTVWYTNATAGGEFDITGSNTFSVLKCNDTNGQTIKITAGTTQTISPGGWQVSGASGFPINIAGITAAQFTLSIVSGNVISNFLSLTNSIVRGGARWFAQNSTNVSGNNGWRFAQASNRQMSGLGATILIV